MTTRTIQFDGVSVDLKRVGDSVTGFVNFPPAFKRSPVEIRFRAADGGDIGHASRRPVGGRLSATRKAEAIEEYRRRINAHRGASRGDLAKTVAVQFGTSARSIQRWDRAESVQGETGLSDKSSASRLPCRNARQSWTDAKQFGEGAQSARPARRPQHTLFRPTPIIKPAFWSDSGKDREPATSAYSQIKFCPNESR